MRPFEHDLHSCDSLVISTLVRKPSTGVESTETTCAKPTLLFNARLRTRFENEYTVRANTDPENVCSRETDAHLGKVSGCDAPLKVVPYLVIRDGQEIGA